MSKGNSGLFKNTKGNKTNLKLDASRKNIGISNNKVINKHKQNRHLLPEAKNTQRSYIYGNIDKAQELVIKYCGKGYSPKENMEIISTDEIVGIYKDRFGNIMESNVIVIVTSKTGTHVFPGKPKKEEKQNGI